MGFSVFLSIGIVLEVSTFAGAYFTFSTLRRNESKRRNFYNKYPKVLNAYYTCEDYISGGHLTGSKLKQADLNRWIQEIGTTTQ